ncbi:hypothetical protein HKX48_005052 [Thoreauomyces humboldtii]|nr:hypothetical protein HKX48_005052 [Thoreauomyces humboldtii]
MASRLLARSQLAALPSVRPRSSFSRLTANAPHRGLPPWRTQTQANSNAAAAAAAATTHAGTTPASSSNYPVPPPQSAAPTAAGAGDRPFKARSTLELVNSLVVFQLCAMPWLVKASPTLLDFAEKVHMNAPAYAIIKRTFFRHFCGGEDLKEVVPTMDAFKKARVGSILDLALEADVDEASLTGAAAHEQCKKVAQQFRESIDIASQTSGSFIAIKVTALLPVSILLSWSNTALLLQRAFNDADKDGDGKLSANEFASIATVFPGLSGKKGEDVFRLADKDKDGKVDWIDMSDTFSLSNPDSARLLVRAPLAPLTPDNPLVSDEDIDTATLVMPDIKGVAQHAREKRVRIMVDAEQTYFQPAVDDVGLMLCREYNPALNATTLPAGSPRGPVIYNTYQLYLRDAYSRMVRDVERAERGGYALGIKIVRGAYMHAERERAEAIGISDPIHPNLEATHAAYNSAIDFLIEKISTSTPSTVEASSTPGSDAHPNTRPLSFVVASHNAGSIAHAKRAMAKHHVAPQEGSVAFAQLMGMQDPTTYALAGTDYKVFKYIPYGPIGVTIPYLQRRALENADVLKGDGGIAKDRAFIIKELTSRIKGQ